MMESTPTPAIKIPILCFQLINSLNNNHDNSTVNAGNQLSKIRHPSVKIEFFFSKKQ